MIPSILSTLLLRTYSGELDSSVSKKVSTRDVRSNEHCVCHYALAHVVENT